MILAAGLGSRLKPLTDKVPKALVQVKGTPLLMIAINKLSKLKPDMIVANSFHHSEQVRNFVSDNNWPVSVQVISEVNLLGTGGGILNAGSFLRDDSCLVYNVDILSNFDITKLINAKVDDQTIASLAISTASGDDSLIVNDQGEVIGHSQLTPNVAGKKVGFCGVHMIYPPFWDFTYLLDRPPSSIIEIYLEALKLGYNIKTTMYEPAQWLDVGTTKSFELANSEAWKIE